MDLSRRGFFKGVAALFAGGVAAQLPSCTTGPAPLAVAQEPIVDVVKDRRVSRWLHPGHTILTATEVEENHRIERTYIAKRFLPYSPDPLIEGITPTPAALLERGQPVG